MMNFLVRYCRKFLIFFAKELSLVRYWIIWKIKFWANDSSEGLMRIVKM